MSTPDEPLFDDSNKVPDRDAATDSSLESRIRTLLEDQLYGVLCVEQGGQPYGALVAYAFSQDLRHVLFATPIATRKHRSLSANNRVALVVDNRSSHTDDLMGVEALTVTGKAQRIESGDDYSRWAQLLIERHAYLADFVRVPTCALYRIDVIRFLHVTRFQEVSQWLPGSS